MERNPQVHASSLLTLIVDRENFLGNSLALALEGTGTVVMVAKEKSAAGEGTVFVPFTLPVPKIPDGVYHRIVFVWEEESAHVLEPLAKKTKEWQASLFIVLPEEDEKILEQIAEYDATVLVLGDLFGGRQKQPLDVLLETAKITKRIKLSGMGLHVWHPIFFEDAIKKIVEVVLLQKRISKSFLIGPPHQMTALGIAHLLQKEDPEILVDFSGTETLRQQQHLPSAFDTYDAGNKLREYFRTLQVRYKKVNKTDVEPIFSKQPAKRKKTKGLYILYTLIILLLLPFLLIAGGGSLGMLFLSSGIQDVEKGQFIAAKQKVDAAVITFGIAKMSSDALAAVNTFALKNNTFEPIHRQIVIGNQLTIVVDEMISAGEKVSGILTGRTQDAKADAESAVGSVKDISVVLSSIGKQDVPQVFWDIIDKAKQVSLLSSSVIDELPQLLGVGEDKKYLILFQNNMELRPGGGFIGSYGLLTLHNGAVMSFTIHDVYDADGQLKGHVEPPFAIRRYIPLVHLYLRDSNFDGDFSRSAQTTAYMLAQETGDRVDGVIGIDLNVLKGILGSVGSVYVPSFNQTVTEVNFFQLLEEHAEKNFFPGSTQKKDFLNAFASALLQRLQKGMSGRILLGTMVDAIKQKHIAVSFADPSLQTPFSLADLSGSLTDPRASHSSTLNDFFGTIEANLGVNKVNAFVTRKVSHDLVIQDNGDVRETVTLSLSNNSDGTWPGGIYKNYLRFALPSNAQLTGISLDSVNQIITDAVTDPKIYETKTFIAPKGLEVAREEENGKVLYGFLVNVPLQTTREISISYTIARAYSVDGLERSYSLFLWKQMGIDGYPYHMDVTIPGSMKLLSASLPTTQDGQVISFDTTVDEDTIFSFRMASK